MRISAGWFGLFLISASTVIFCSAVLPLQTANQASKFEVASIKPAAPDGQPSGMACHGVDAPQSTVGLGRCSIHRKTLRDIVSFAYPLSPHPVQGKQVIGGPAWVDSSFFTIEAEAAEPGKVTIADLRQMVAALLADQFKLSLHKERRYTAGYAMVVAEGGAKLTPSAGPVTMLTKPSFLANIKPDQKPLFVPNSTVTNFADILGYTVLRAPVEDRTAVDGKFDFVLYSMETGDISAPSLFTALKEQLGLKLESVKQLAIDYIVIDHAEKPPEPVGHK